MMRRKKKTRKRMIKDLQEAERRREKNYCKLKNEAEEQGEELLVVSKKMV